MPTVDELRSRIVGNSGAEIEALRMKLRDALNRRAREEAARGVFRCSSCRENFVSPEDGQDTCDDCIRKI